MDVTAPGMSDIMQAVAALHRGDRDVARAALLRLWAAQREGAPQRCTIAHFLADTEDEPAAELEWDLRALEAATGFRDEQDRDPVDPSLAGFLPSLHLNVGDACRRLGDRDRAARHADAGLKRAALLGDDGYAATIRGGLERLRRRLEEGDGPSARPPAFPDRFRSRS